MSINKKIIVGVVAALSLAASSCHKFLDVNKNPNIAQSATMSTVLPAAQLYLASAVGVDLEINGSFWSGYWTQSPNSSQYRNLEQYNPGQDVFSTAWDNLYSANENFFQLGKLADSMKNKPYKAISLYMRAYAFQLITDAWGDAPFHQALRGQAIDSGFTNPKYDSQRVIYMSLLKYIDSAEYLISTASASSVADDDLIYHGDLDKWLAFGHTLKLKMLVRLTKRDPAFAAAELSKLFAASPTFIDDNTQNAQINFSTGTTNRNPLYAEYAGLGFVQNIVASKTCVDSMNSNNDDRLFVFYTSLSNGTVAGITQGDYNTSVPTSSYSQPSTTMGIGTSAQSQAGAAPVKFLTAAESYFLRAEVAANGWATTPETDDTYFYFGIDTSFNDYSLSSAAYKSGGGYWTTYPVGGTAAEKTRFIITQKWFAMCGNQGFEAWTELRRTGYPDFFVPSVTSQTGPNAPARFLYPTSESTRNINYPGLAPITQRVWWDF